MHSVSKLGGALLVTLALAGCGGSSSSSSSLDQTASFKTSFDSAAGQLKQGSHAIGVAIQQASSRTDAQLAATFHQLASRWQHALSQLQTLTPPSNLAVTFNTLTGAATRVEADLNAIVAAAETHSSSAAEQASATLVTDILAAKSASTTITDKLGAQ
jgi:hypothetical protein